ncbi:MAG: helix-turn-helix domain-containing protein [Desulfovibrio sp.]|jgi:predicted site-specific integrase-resolvase|nr:helix-turn-helix domain-containing protein [Desulfovibrio sp.]
MDRFLSMREAMQLAGIKSRNTIKRLIREGTIEAQRLPSPGGHGHWRIKESSLYAICADTIRTQALDMLRRHRA